MASIYLYDGTTRKIEPSLWGGGSVELWSRDGPTVIRGEDRTERYFEMIENLSSPAPD
jgi:hypothetical protein